MRWRRASRLPVLVAMAVICMTAPPVAKQSTPEAALAARIAAAPDPAARRMLLADAPDLTNLELLRALIREARTLIDATEFERAAQVYEITIELARRLDSRVNLASALIGLGSVHGRRGDYPAAAEALRSGLSVAEAINDVGRIDAALHNLGIVHRLQGDYEAALAHYERVVALADATGRRHELGPTYNNIGNVHLLRGSYRAALEALRESLRLKEAAGDRPGLPSTLTNIGNVHVQLGHPGLALEYYRRSLEVAEEVGQLARRASTLNDIGHAYAASGQRGLALQYYGRALAQHQAAGQQAETAATLHNIGAVHAARGEMAAALDHHQRSLAIREAINDRPGVAGSLIALGALALSRGDMPAALALARRAAALAGETGSREASWESRLLAGRAQEARGKTEQARGAYLAAIETIEDLRVEAGAADRDRQRYFERRLEPYHRLAALLVGAGEADRALETAERARARVLFEVLRNGPAERRLLTAGERERERTIERRLSERRLRVWSEEARVPRDDAALAQATRELAAARAEHGEFRAALYASHPALLLQRGDLGIGRAEAATRLLQSGRTAVLEYLVAEDAAFLFVLLPSTSDGAAGVRTTAFRLPLPRERLTTLVEDFRGRLERRDLDFRTLARDLHGALLGPARGLIQGVTSLVIVPDGVLWELPFQALVMPDGRYLLEQSAITYSPSLAVLAELSDRAPQAGAGGTPRLIAIGPPATDATSGPGAPAFAPLPDASRQVRRLTDVYGRDDSVVLEGGAATESALRAAVGGRPSVVHFATHGVLENAAPMYSYLLLTGDPAAGASGDGRLEAWEVADLRLPLDAVVVAACETALGRVGPGEGMIGLSWAFALAGSPRTVASLWKVDAASTAELMFGFHRRFNDGLRRNRARPGAAESLRQAALTLLRGDRYRHPFYWAGFIVVGDGS